MAILTADSAGVVSGKFTIPANMRSGTKLVRATGQGGTIAHGYFTGRGTLTTEERRRVFTVEEFQYDPLAQTFTLSEARHIAAIDLWFAVAGTHDVLVQVRNTAAGFPGQTILAEARIKPADLLVNGTATRINFPTPVWLDANREYAIVVVTDDATAALYVATLGKFDAGAQKWITGQAYQVGVLLSSSNAQTWTAHQDKDLTFRLLAAKFTQTTQTIDVGTVNVLQASDLLAPMSIDIPATGASAEVLATAPSGEVFRMQPNEPVAVPSRINGDINIQIALTGNEKVSPVVYPGLQFVAGNMEATGQYVSRAFPVGTSSRIAVTFEAKISGTASVVVEIQDGVGAWVAVPFDSGVEVGDGFSERTHILLAVTAVETRVRLTLTGTAQYRPIVRKLRAVASA